MESTNGNSRDVGSNNDFSAQNTPDDVMDHTFDRVNGDSRQAARKRTASTAALNNTVERTESTNAANPETGHTATQTRKKAETDDAQELDEPRAGNCYLLSFDKLQIEEKATYWSTATKVVQFMYILQTSRAIVVNSVVQCSATTLQTSP